MFNPIRTISRQHNQADPLTCASAAVSTRPKINNCISFPGIDRKREIRYWSGREVHMVAYMHMYMNTLMCSYSRMRVDAAGDRHVVRSPKEKMGGGGVSRFRKRVTAQFPVYAFPRSSAESTLADGSD